MGLKRHGDSYVHRPDRIGRIGAAKMESALLGSHFIHRHYCGLGRDGGHCLLAQRIVFPLLNRRVNR
jgi:hypothetical protein